ncbi:MULTISPECIES: response regulator [Haloferacaceae]|uniref:Response regulator n=1 Tax=Halorubrum glutamatedens TaxID=2707018 RepID=A0ABD5QLT4_9EURY|nr:response regulator [Halobellus captivus]
MTDDRDRRTTGTATRTNPADSADPADSANRGDDRHFATEVTDPPGNGAGRSSRIDVLHVEPDPESAEVLVTFLERFETGVSVRSVDRVSEARDAFADVDFVITEQRLPDGTGVELLETARKRGIRTPFLFHTICHDPVVEARAFEAGATAYVRKRSTRGQYDRLLGVLRDHLEGVGGERSRSTRRSTAAPSEPKTNARPTPLRSEE